METNSQQELIKIENLKRYYTTAGEVIKALDGITTEIHTGEFTAVAGPSGSGKSTLLHLIGLLDQQTEGTIFLHGNDTNKLGQTEKAEYRKNHIGFIFQAYNLVPVLSVVENVEYVMLLQGVDKQERLERAYDILKQVGLEGFENRMPLQLSGGQQQRVTVARAIAARPSLILADEPTANLDTKNSLALIELMEQLNENYQTSFIFSTHDQKIMDRAKRLILVEDGRIVSDEKRTH